MSDRPVPIPRRFRRAIGQLTELASAAEREPNGGARRELIEHISLIRSQLSWEDPAEFRAVILRESGLALMVGAPAIREIDEAHRHLGESVRLGSDSTQMQIACSADLAAATLAKAISGNDRAALIEALSVGDDPSSGPALLAHTGMALSLVPAIAPDLMTTSMGSPGQFTQAIPGWEQRVAAFGSRNLDPFLLSLTAARLNVLRAFHTPASSSPTPGERLAEALLLVEEFAPANGVGRSHWIRNSSFAAVAVGTICSVATSSIALLGRSVANLRDSADEVVRLAADREVTSAKQLCEMASWLGAQMAEMSGAAVAGMEPRYSLGRFEGQLLEASEVDSVVGAAQVIGRDVRFVAAAAKNWNESDV